MVAAGERGCSVIVMMALVRQWSLPLGCVPSTRLESIMDTPGINHSMHAIGEVSMLALSVKRDQQQMDYRYGLVYNCVSDVTQLIAHP